MYNLHMRTRFYRKWIFLFIPFILVGLYYLPPVHDRLAWRLDLVRTQIKYFFNPPEEAVFQPQQQAQVDLVITPT